MVTKAKKAVGKKTTKKTAKKMAVKKSAPAKAVKKAPRKRTAPATQGARKQAVEGAVFAPGSDLDAAFELMQIGGDDRRDVMHKIRDSFTSQGRVTANGNGKPVSTIMNQVMHRARELGYDIVSTWKLAKVNDGAPKAPVLVGEAGPVVTPPVKKAAKKVSKKAHSTAKKVAKKTSKKAIKK